MELYEDINKLQALATAPELYGEFVKLNAVQKVDEAIYIIDLLTPELQLSELLDHENVDITLATIELMNELTDPDALGEMESDDCLKVQMFLFPLYP